METIILPYLRLCNTHICLYTMASINRARNYLPTVDNTYCLLNFKLGILNNAKAKSDCKTCDYLVLTWWLTPLIKNGLCYLVNEVRFCKIYIYFLYCCLKIISFHNMLFYVTSFIQHYTILYMNIGTCLPYKVY